MSQPQLSIEEHMRGLTNYDMTIQDLLAVDIGSLSFSQTSTVNRTCVPYNEFDLIDPQNCDIGKNDLDDYLPKTNHTIGDLFDRSSYLAIENDLWELFGRYPNKSPQQSSQINPLPLSSSVAVPLQRQDLNIFRPIQLAYELEQGYKSRYKTDYYSQDGHIRSPRYVADRNGNHFITLKIKPGVEGYIRIDWITVLTAENKHYSMPYKMQPNSQRPDLADENPMYRPIQADSSGLMKEYVVLIKYKQDKLKEVQPLQVFPPSFESLDKVQPLGTRVLSPKKLIERFQLDKSQLAFTFCPLAPDRKSCTPDWSTTVISTVMTERSTDSSSKRKITCPNCSHLFDITVDEGDDVQPRKVVKKR